VDYKKIIKSRRTRRRILQMFNFVPDKAMLKIQYRIKLGRKLDLENPKRFTEKLQWYKLYYRTPLMRTCVDKYDVRGYVKECGLEEILIPLVGIYNSEEEVNFDMLPKTCVIKDTLGGGGNAVILCKDKDALNLSEVKKQMKRWTASDTSYKPGGREWPFGGKKHRILIEEMLPSKPEEGGLIDYKFFCFNGEPGVVYVIADRKVGEKAGFGVFTSAYEKLDVVRCDEKPLTRDVPKPKVYDQMLEVARKLSKPFPEVRVDLYCVEDKIYFGEMTFYDGSGYMSFAPDEFDFEMGEMFDLPKRSIK
jgi:hypothetical protein